MGLLTNAAGVRLAVKPGLQILRTDDLYDLYDLFPLQFII